MAAKEEQRKQAQSVLEQNRLQQKIESLPAQTPEPQQEIGESLSKDDLAQDIEITSPNGGPPNLDRQPSRTSNRVRPNINYTNLAQGTGEVSGSIDYREPQGKVPTKKLTGLKVNQEVFKKCLDFFHKIQEATQYRDLITAGQAHIDFMKNMEVLV